MQDDQLVGYLLKALDPAEMIEVEQQLRLNPSIRSRLEQLEAMLEPLAELASEEAEDVDFVPPPGLVANTLNEVDRLREQEASANDSMEVEHRPTIGLSEVMPNSDSRNSSWWDVLFCCCAAVAFVAMLFPAIYQTREDARTAVCEDQLRQLGQQLTRYASTSSDQRLPNVEPSGREAFAGVYAVRLKGAGLLEEDSLVWCPTEPVGGSVPELETLAFADPLSLSRWQRQAGGRYAYNLGVIDADRYQAPRFNHRSKFAVMSDVVNYEQVLPHPGSFNVLYEDGHVERRGLHSFGLFADHPFLNRSSRREAGLDANDAVLGPSAAPPFVWVNQR